MKSFSKLIFISLCVALAVSVRAQHIGKDQISLDYKNSCAKEQVKLHAKLKDMPASAFTDYCDCTTRQLVINISPAQLKELDQDKSRPDWLKAAEQSASKACLKESTKIQV